MITDFDMSQTGIGRHLGYWRSGRDNSPTKALPWPGDFVDTTWDEAEREAIAKYLEAGKTHQSWRGNSSCRLGGHPSCEHLRGYRDFTDGIYVWPEAFAHYVRVHGVKPPQEFIDHALGRVVRTEIDHPTRKPEPGYYPLPPWVQIGAKCRVKDDIFGLLPPGALVTVHSWADSKVNVEIDPEWQKKCGETHANYLRLDFPHIFEPLPG